MSGGVYEDECQKLLRLINEKRATYVERIAQGGVSPENVAGGYRHTTGVINGLDEAADIVREVFKAWLPATPSTVEPRRRDMSDY